MYGLGDEINGAREEINEMKMFMGLFTSEEYLKRILEKVGTEESPALREYLRLYQKYT
jgi:hypothetical protein